MGKLYAHVSVCVVWGGWVRFEPCVLPKMSISSSVHMSSVNMFVYNVHVSSSDSVQLLLRT